MRLPAILAVGCSLGAALPDVPTPESFLRRIGVQATVLGDYVYINGGELNQLVDGEASGTQVVNSTLSINMSKSWKSGSVAIRTILNPGPAKSDTVLWTNTRAGVFYSWGGRFPGGRNMTDDKRPWKFTADGKGGGSWEIEDASNEVLLTRLHPTEYGAVVNTHTMGFVIGGVADAWTELNHPTADPIPGMVAFHMDSSIWQNGTVNFSPFGASTLNQGVAEYLPSFGPNGLIIVLGGYTPSITGDLNKSDGPPLDLRNLTFFNPVTKQNYWQVTTGDVPPTPRGRACTAVFPSPDGGYDIFLFGGSNGRDEYNYQDAYILSLPGFVWTKLPDAPGGPRWGNSCVRVGKRQVLSVGGADKSLGDKDEAAQGLLLFDMTTWKWGDSYDAEAADYEQAKEIKEWYTDGSLANVEWSSDEVQKLFVAQKTTSTGTTLKPTATDSRISNSGFGDSSDDSEKTPVGAIVGGAIGGVAAVAIVVAGLWIFIRRRRKQQEPAAGQNGGEDDNDSNNPPVNPPDASSTGATTSPTANHAELPGATFFPSGGGYFADSATATTPSGYNYYNYYNAEKDTDPKPGVQPGPRIVPAEVSAAGHEYTELPPEGHSAYGYYPQQQQPPQPHLQAPQDGESPAVRYPGPTQPPPQQPVEGGYGVGQGGQFGSYGYATYGRMYELDSAPGGR
ncbi:hypothetical protein VTG60DRAFT_1961 [Thermothelomyces hinnuleus]